MGYHNWNAGYQRITTSGVIGDSGKPTLVTGVFYRGTSGTAGPYIKDGKDTTGTTVVQLGPTISGQGASRVVNFDYPVMLKNGCFGSFVTNTVEMTVFYVQQSITN